ncbi:MAG TPA: glycosyltransferase family 4 protein [Acidimicrobiales bacterium]|nr:glycosyltransferase family 4 protein [Acidimicrobiales bacterium]
MRTLVIAGDYPWPEDSGPRLRLAMVLRGLHRCGPVELASVVSRFRTDFDVPDRSLGLDKVVRIGFDNRPRTGIAMVPTLWRPSMPLGLPWRDGPRVQRALARFMSGHYDLVWFFGARPWVLSGTPVFAPTILDLDDLEDQKIVARLSVPRPHPAGWTGRLQQMAGTLVAGEEIRRWHRLHRRADHRTEAIAVCSQLDAERAREQGLTRVFVVPNGYRAPADPVGRAAVGSPPVVLFQGQLHYPPNIEAARWLARDVGPALRSLVPEAEIRLVGDHHPELAALDDPPRVSVVGRVDDITAELARADIVVVPVRYGSGTRVKILEAFAHRIPVVSTTLGAEGIGAEDGVHLLIADTVPALADACSRLIRDPALRDALTSRAHRVFSERFRSDIIEAGIEQLARGVAGRREAV